MQSIIISVTYLFLQHPYEGARGSPYSSDGLTVVENADYSVD